MVVKKDLLMFEMKFEGKVAKKQNTFKFKDFSYFYTVPITHTLESYLLNFF